MSTLPSEDPSSGPITSLEDVPPSNRGRYSQGTILFEKVPADPYHEVRLKIPPEDFDESCSERLRNGGVCMAVLLTLWSVLAIGLSFTSPLLIHFRPLYGAPWLRLDVLLNVNLFLLGFWLLFFLCVVCPSRSQDVFYYQLRIFVTFEVATLGLIVIAWVVGYIRHLVGYDGNIDGEVPSDLDFVTPGFFMLIVGGSVPACCVYATCFYREQRLSLQESVINIELAEE